MARRRRVTRRRRARRRRANLFRTAPYVTQIRGEPRPVISPGFAWYKRTVGDTVTQTGTVSINLTMNDIWNATFTQSAPQYMKIKSVSVWCMDPKREVKVRLLSGYLQDKIYDESIEGNDVGNNTRLPGVAIRIPLQQRFSTAYVANQIIATINCFPVSNGTTDPVMFAWRVSYKWR